MLNFSTDTLDPIVPTASDPSHKLTLHEVPRHAGPVSRRPAIDAMFKQMCELRASDLHLSATMPPLVRLDGEMRRLDDTVGPLSADIVLRLLSEIMPPDQPRGVRGAA
jgi:hypothetical protein